MDLHVIDSGSFITLFALSDTGSSWISDNLDFEPWQVSGLSICIDYRYFDDIAKALQDSDLLIEYN